MTDAAPARDIRICFIGDSFVAGTGDQDGLGWVGRLCAGTGLTVYNLGIRRDTSRDVAARWRAEAERRLPAGIDGRLVLSFGVNDCLIEDGHPRVPAVDSVANLDAILARSPWPVLVVGPPPIADEATNDRIEALSAAMADGCAARGVACLEVASTLMRDRRWMTEVAEGDGAHPGREGYAALAERVGAWPAWQAWRD